MKKTYLSNLYPNEKTIGQRIYETRKSRGLSQRELMEMTGIDLSTISCYERDRHFPPLKKLELIAEALEVSPAWLAGWEKDGAGRGVE